MPQIYIAKNGQQLGPFDETFVAQHLQSGKYSGDDLCWWEGQTDWQSLRVAFPQLCTSAPPPIPASVQPPSTAAPTSNAIEFTDLFWLGFVVLIAITAFLGIVTDFASLESEDAGLAASVLSFPVLIAAFVVSVWLHYRLWQNLPERYRATTPAKAAGFMFIPFFNFYWAFITYPKLSEGMVNWSTGLGRNPLHDTRGLAMANAVLFVVSLTIGLLPLIGSLIGIGATVVWLIYYYQVINEQKMLVPLSRTSG